MTRTWIYHDIYPGGPARLESAITYVVAPAVAAMTARPGVDTWHFLNFTDELGAHVRLRFGGSGAALDEAFPHHDASLRAAVSELAAKCHTETPSNARDAPRHVGCHAAVYEREDGKYGGRAGVALAERTFERSSTFALSIIVDGPLEGLSRAAIALATMNRLLPLLAPDAEAEFLHSYATYWSAPPGRPQATSLFTQLGERARRNVAVAAEWLRVVETDCVATALVDAFAIDVGALLDEADGGDRQVREHLGFHHLHLTNNRLGLSVVHEALLALSLLGLRRA